MVTFVVNMRYLSVFIQSIAMTMKVLKIALTSYIELLINCGLSSTDENNYERKV